MIEGISCEDKEAEEYIEATNFRIANPLSTLLEQVGLVMGTHWVYPTHPWVGLGIT